MKELHKLSKELEKFCIDNNIKKAKSGYLMGLFIKHNQELPTPNAVEQSKQLLALAQYMCKHQNNLDGKTAKDYLQDFLSQ